MNFAWFSFFHHPDPDARLSAPRLARIEAMLRQVRKLSYAHLMVPAGAIAHAFPGDPPAPLLALQTFFDSIGDLEESVRVDGPLSGLLDVETFPELQTCRAEQQAMAARSFPAPAPADGLSDGNRQCAYLVHYPGEAENLPRWLDYYVRHHPQIMAEFDAIRQIEVYSRIDWCGSLPWPRAHYMQRNKQVFDDAEALSRAMLSPVLLKMRADYHQFPPFTGGNVHYVMACRTILPQTTAKGGKDA